MAQIGVQELGRLVVRVGPGRVLGVGNHAVVVAVGEDEVVPVGMGEVGAGVGFFVGGDERACDLPVADDLDGGEGVGGVEGGLDVEVE